MNYKVSEIAKFTVATSKKMGVPINCSKLHLVVTMLWINYYKKTKQNLFNENISAGSIQPVIGAIDLLYRSFGNNNISVKSALDLMTSIKIEDQDVIREYLTPLIKANAEDLKKILCSSDSAWDKTRKANPGENKPVIPFDLLAHTTLVKKKTENNSVDVTNTSKNKPLAQTSQKPKLVSDSVNNSKNNTKPVKNQSTVEADFGDFFSMPIDENKDKSNTVADTESTTYNSNETVFEEETNDFVEDIIDESVNESSDELADYASTEDDALEEYDFSEAETTPYTDVENKNETEVEEGISRVSSKKEEDEFFDSYVSDTDEIEDFISDESNENDSYYDNYDNPEAESHTEYFDDTNDSSDFVGYDYSKDTVTEKPLSDEQYKAMMENKSAGILKLGNIKGLGKKMTDLIIVPRNKINGYEIKGSYAIISISSPKNKPINFISKGRDFKGVLSVSFDDSEGKYGMKEKDAEKIAEFVIKMSSKARTLIIQSDYGYSRSAGILAAIYYAFDQNGKIFFTSGDYCPNAHCYELMLSAFNISFDKTVIDKLDNYSKDQWLVNHESLPFNYIETPKNN